MTAKTAKVLAASVAALSLGPAALTAQTPSTWVCNAPRVWEGQQVNDHLGRVLTAAEWDGDGVVEILAAGFQKWDNSEIATWPESDKNHVNILERGVSWDQGSICADSVPSLRIEGVQDGDRFGWGAAFVGDLNPGPNVAGFDDPAPNPNARTDFVVGAPRGPELFNQWTHRGRAYVFLSTEFAPTGALASASSASLIIEGESSGHRFGYSIAKAGDWNDDTFDDFAIGAPGGDDAPGFAGRVYIISGKLVRDKALAYFTSQNPNDQLVSVSDVEITHFDGDSYLDRFGFSVAFVGDVGDDLSRDEEIVAGAPMEYYDSTIDATNFGGYGYVKVLFPNASSPFYPEQRIDFVGCQPPIPDPALLPDEPENGVSFGASVGRVDIDGDDRWEILVGAPFWDSPDDPPFCTSFGESVGKVWVIDLVLACSPPWTDPGCAPPPLPNLTLNTVREHAGTAIKEEYGRTVTELGDYLGLGYNCTAYGVGSSAFGPGTAEDACLSNCSNITACLGGTPDCLVDAGGRVAGKLSVYSAATGALLHEYLGEDSRDSASTSVVSIGDVTGDGKDDLVLSAMRWPGSPADEYGRVYYVPAP